MDIVAQRRRVLCLCVSVWVENKISAFGVMVCRPPIKYDNPHAAHIHDEKLIVANFCHFRYRAKRNKNRNKIATHCTSAFVKWGSFLFTFLPGFFRFLFSLIPLRMSIRCVVALLSYGSSWYVIRLGWLGCSFQLCVLLPSHFFCSSCHLFNSKKTPSSDFEAPTVIWMMK